MPRAASAGAAAAAPARARASGRAGCTPVGLDGLARRFRCPPPDLASAAGAVAGRAGLAGCRHRSRPRCSAGRDAQGSFIAQARPGLKRAGRPRPARPGGDRRDAATRHGRRTLRSRWRRRPRRAAWPPGRSSSGRRPRRQHIRPLAKGRLRRRTLAAGAGIAVTTGRIIRREAWAGTLIFDGSTPASAARSATPSAADAPARTGLPGAGGHPSGQVAACADTHLVVAKAVGADGAPAADPSGGRARARRRDRG